jgi:hypothetical protein
MIELLGLIGCMNPLKLLAWFLILFISPSGPPEMFGRRGRFDCTVRLIECGFISIQGKRATLAMIVSPSLRFSSKATKHF